MENSNFNTYMTLCGFTEFFTDFSLYVNDLNIV